jgi:hypothetical protein
MKLNDVRRMTVRRQVKVRFALPGGAECVIDEHGLGRVPQLDRPPEFSMEEEFGRATEFVVEPARVGTGGGKSQLRKLTRPELEELVGPGGPSREADHEE